MAGSRPQLKHGALGAKYVEDGPPILVCDNLLITDRDSSSLVGAVVRFSRGYEAGLDLLGFVNQNGITGSWDAATGTLTLTGVASLAAYEAALRSITYAYGGDDPQSRNRVVKFQVDDGGNLSREISIRVGVIGVNDAPVLTVDPVLAYTSLQAPAALNPTLSLVDVDSDVRGATVTISGNYHPGEDVLSWVNTSKVRGTFNAKTGVLQFSGRASAAEYEQVLRSITYTDKLASPSSDPRTITIQVQDSDRSGVGSFSNVGTITVTFSGAPHLTTSGSQIAYTEGAPAVTLDAGLTLKDPDDPNMAGATVSITAGFDAGDRLLFTDTATITGTYNTATGVLTLNGSATIADYQAALRSIQFVGTTDDPSPSKTITWVVSDGSDNSAPVTTTINVTPVNDAPVLSISASLAYTEKHAATAIAPAATISDPDSHDFKGGSLTASFSANGTSADQLTVIDQGTGPGQIGVSGSTITYGGVAIGTFSGGANGAALVITFTSSAATLAAVQALVRDIGYSNSSNNPSTLARTVNFKVVDGDGNANGGLDTGTASATINVTAVNDAPTVTLSGAASAYTEGGPAVVLDGSIALADVDSTVLSGATVSITAGFDAGDTLLFTDTAHITGSYNAATGVLTLTGSATVAEYEAALQSIKYQGTSDAPTTSKTVSWVVSDGSDASAPVTTTINVTPVNDAPTLSIAATLAYTENDAVTAIAPAAALSDPDSPDFNGGSLTVAFTANGTSADQLTLIDQGTGAGQIGVSGSTVTYEGVAIGTFTGGVNGTALVITFTSSAATPAAVQALVRDIGYSNSSDDPSTQARTVGFTIVDGDGGADTGTASATVNVTAVNDAPVVTPSAGHAAWTEAGPAAAIDPSIALADPDSATLENAVVRISSNYLPGEDVLGFTNTPAMGNISGSFDQGVGALILYSSGATATLAQWQAALASVTFYSTSTSPGSTRTILFQVNDGVLTSNLGAKVIDITEANSAPTVTTSGGSAAFVEKSPAVTVDGGIVVDDGDTATLVGATVRIGTGFQSGQDVLAFTAAGSITGSYDASTGTLTLSGIDTLANYQAALASVTYSNTSDAPDTSPRTIEFQVDDGQGVSNLSTVATRTVTVAATNDAPVLVVGATLSYTENNAATLIAPSATVTDPDSADFNGGSLTVHFTANGTSDDQLTIQSQGTGAGQIGVSGSTVTYGGMTIGTFAGGVNGADLVISFSSAAATPAAVQALVRAVVYANTSDNPSTGARTVSFTVVDGDGGTDTGSGTATINVTAVNDAPVLAGSGAVPVAYTENDPATVIDGGITIDDVDSATLAGATIRISTNFQSGQDVLAFTPTGSITGSYNAATGVLTLSGTDTLAHYQAALQSVTYENTSDNPSAAARTVTFEVNDGSSSHNLSNGVTHDIAVTPVNDAPAITAGNALAYTENAAATAISSTLTLVDAEGDNITGATVTISSNFQSGEDVLSFTPTGSITGSYDAATGVLTLSGTDTAANYQAALNSVTYFNSSDNPSTAPRTISFAATDSHGDTGAAATATVNVTAVNDAPANTVPPDASVGTAFSNTSMSISGVSIADIDAGSGNLTVTLSALNGGLTVSLAGGASVSGGANGGGSVTLSGTVSQLNAALSTLSYKSADGFTGSDTVTVTTNDGGNSGTGGAKVDTDSFHIGVVPQVFVIDNTDATADSASAGTAANPFNSIASFNALAGAGVGDYVYIMHGTGTYSEAGGFTLQNNQQVYGQGQTLQFTNPVTGAVVTVGTGSAGDAPTLSITGSGATGVTLAQGNTLTGFNIATTLGNQTGIADGNGTVGNLAVNNMNVTGSGMAVNIDQGGTLAVSLGTLSSTGSTQQGVKLASVAGSFSATGGTISGSTGTGFLVGDGSGTANTGGTAVISYGGSISVSGSARTVDIEDRSAGAGSVTFSGSLNHASGNGTGVFVQDIAGGAITFSGSNIFSTGTASAIALSNITGGSVTFSGDQSITTGTGTGIALSSNSAAVSFTGSQVAINTTGGTGVSVSSNSGAVSFNNTGNGLDVSTTGATGMNVSNSGTLTIQGSGNSIMSTSATAINVTNTTIGAPGLNFQSVSSSGGVNGIALSNTGTGSLNVTGTGTANSGGTMALNTGDAINVTNGAVNLGYMMITGSGGAGINMSNMLGSSSLSYSTITNFGLASNNGITGNAINIVNTGTSAGSMTVSNSTISGGASGNDGIFMEAQGSGAMALTVTNSTFSGLYGDGVQVNATSSAVGVERVTISNSSFSNSVAGTGNGGISLNPFGFVTFYADVNNNTFSSIMSPGTTLGAIGVTDGGNANAEVTIRNNTINNIAGARGITYTADGGATKLLIDHNTVDNLGSTTKSAINVNFQSNPGSGTVANGSVTVSNNEIGQHGSTAGKLWTTGDGGANAILLTALDGATMTAAVTGNFVSANTAFVTEVVRLRAAGNTVPGSTINATVSNNTIVDTEPTNHVEFDATAGTGALASTINLNIFNNTVPAAGVGVIKLTENALSTLNVTQSSAGAVASANNGGTVPVTGSPQYGASAPPAPLTPALPLLASGPGDGSHELHAITTAELAWVVAAAANRWAQLPLTDAQLQALSDLSFAVGHLSGDQIGAQVPGLIVFDADAGGRGWFVDATPMDDAEFTSTGSLTHLYGLAGDAATRIDLLTAVMHEMGHALGLSDLYGAQDQDNVMYGYLSAGQRLLPTHDTAVTLVGVDMGGAFTLQ